MQSFLRKIKRMIFFKGYSQEVNDLFDSLGTSKSGIRPGKIFANLSFDTEFSLNGPFWRKNYALALSEGKKIKSNFYPIAKYLNDAKIEYNIQLCGGLLDPNLDQKPIFSDEQKKVIKDNPDLFKIDSPAVSYLSKDNVDIGIHSFSHRKFSSLSPEEAEWEIKESINLVRKVFNQTPTFMSYPRNRIAHPEIVIRNGLQYRSDKNSNFSKNTIPTGLCLSPILITPKELDKVIKEIKARQESYFLHLWQHFAETNLEEFKEYLAVLRRNNCQFVNLKSYKLRHFN